MSVTIHNIPAETVGFKPERTRSGKIVLSLFILSLLAYIVVLFAISFKMQYVLEFKTEATIATIASISVFCFIFLQMLLKGNWFGTTDKDGKTYTDKLAEFYDKIPDRESLTYRSFYNFNSYPDTKRSERIATRALSFGQVVLHQKNKTTEKWSDGTSVNTTEEFQVFGLPDRLKLMR